MAAVKSPLSPSLSSQFPSYTDSPQSPTSLASKRASGDSGAYLHPNTIPSPLLPSPSEAGPSPIASSNGTDFEDTNGDNTMQDSRNDNNDKIDKQSGRNSIKIQTIDENGVMHNATAEDEPASVIHAPEGYGSFLGQSPNQSGRVTTPTPSQKSDATVISPSDQEAAKISSPIRPAISTSVPPSHDPFITPRAQTIHEAKAIEKDKATRVQRNNLEDILESRDDDNVTMSEQATSRGRTPDQMSNLRAALTQCWILCDTLSGLSHVHREQAFRQKSKRDGREQAWKSCWRMCQRLYDAWVRDQLSPISPTLELCREFCQSLFEVRQRDNDLADSVLRVSFELNNHLYHSNDQEVPDEFKERTLDFYITLCHRLMKQRNQMLEEIDNLLSACWGLVESLTNLRQAKRDGKPADEDLLSSAVQACWELCEIFQKGWTQIRPERTTPRPSQPPYGFYRYPANESAITIQLPEDEDLDRLVAETPTSTIFEEDKMSPQSPGEDHVPNILVLGPDSGNGYDSDWSSSASSYSEYSKQTGNTRQSQTTGSSTNTVRNVAEDPRLACLRLLALRAALNLDHKIDKPLAPYVKMLPTNSFGESDAQKLLLVQYKTLVASDHTFRQPGLRQRASYADVARSVRWVASSGQQYVWIKDLFKWVVGVHLDEADHRTDRFINS